MKKIIFAVSISGILITGCSKNFNELNIDTKNPSTVPSYTLFTNAQRVMASTLASPNVNLNIFRLIVQHWQETQYVDESNYDLATRTINDNIWDAVYRDVLRDLTEAKKLIPTDVKDADKQKNQLAMVEIMEVQAYYYLVTTFGNIPYKEALNISNAFPKYDDAKTVYNDLLVRLDAAIANLNPASEGFGSADYMYKGDVAKWKKFANSLKIKMAITIADDDNVKAKSAIEAAVASGVFTSNDDNAEYTFQSAPPNTNPIWVNLVQSGRDDFVAASTLVDEMNAKNDPRRDNYFTTVNGVFKGAAPGAQTSFTANSNVNPDITKANFPGLFLDYAEVRLILAEAAQRGYSVGGTAAVHYAAGVTASIEYWGGTTAEATAYLAQPSVIYNSANYKQSIGIQKWIALYNRGWDAWVEWRRLDYPKLVPAADALSDIPLRYPYPVNEQNVNRKNYEAAATAIGGDKVETKLFWDKF
jgi:Starch-binding associating with outer membrane